MCDLQSIRRSGRTVETIFARGGLYVADAVSEGRKMFATVTTTDTAGAPLESAAIVGEEMERWLRELDGFQGFLLLACEERAMGITFWASREVAERYAPMRAEFRERMLSIAGVQIEEVLDYDVAFARLAPGFVAG
jgi:hypothetical protein